MTEEQVSTEHTPGPWQARDATPPAHDDGTPANRQWWIAPVAHERRPFGWCQDDERHVKEMAHHIASVTADSRFGGNQEADANARLIAASPALLAAAERVVAQPFDLSVCPYFKGRGTCSFGCRTEPECQTNEPDGGWPLEALQQAIALATGNVEGVGS